MEGKAGKKKRTLSVSKAKKDVESQRSAAGSGGPGATVQSPPPRHSIFLPDVAVLSREAPTGTSVQPPHADVAAEAPTSSQSKRRRTQSQQYEVNSDFEKDLALAIRLSAAEAQTLPPAASRAEDAEQSATHAQQEDAHSGDQACALERQAAVAQCAPSHAEDSCAESERNPDGAPAKVPAATFAARSRSAMTPGVETSNAISARDTKKKRSRFADADEERDQEHAAAQTLHASPEPARKHEQVPKSSKRKTIEDSDEDEIQQAAQAAGPAFPASKSGRGKGPEFKVVEYQTESEESVAIPEANRGLESDMVPDSEDECAENVRCAAGHAAGAVAKTKKAVTEKQVPKEPSSRKRVVQADSSEDEASASDKHQGRVEKVGPQERAQARAKVAKYQTKRAVLSDDHDDDEEGEEEEEEFSEAEESDDDFESNDEDDDFKGKKGKGKKKLPDMGKRQSGKGKKHAHVKSMPACRDDRSSASGKKPSHRSPPKPAPKTEAPSAAEAPGAASGSRKPDQDAKKAAGRKRTKQQKALAELEFSNPGVKAVVSSCGTPGATPLPAPLPAHMPKAQSSATASSVTKGPGTQQPQEQAKVGADAPSKGISTAPLHDAAPEATPSANAGSKAGKGSANPRPAPAPAGASSAAGFQGAVPSANAVSKAGKEPVNARPTPAPVGASSAATYASLPPRVGLSKKHIPPASSHTRAAASGTGLPAAGRSGASLGPPIKVTGPGTKRPGLSKNQVPPQQLHAHLQDKC